MNYRDRISGELRQDLSGILLAGLWQAQSENPVAFIQVGDYILPQGQQHEYPSDKRKKILSRLDDIRLIGQILDENTAWKDWKRISPLIPDIDKKVGMQALEEFILSHKYKPLPCLQQVCAQPRTHLHTEVERVHVSRARRADKNAVAYLAAHTEDWEKRTLRDVLPRRILAKVRYENWNIYENRVAARLIEKLLEYLDGRIANINSILAMASQDDDKKSLHGYYKKQYRLALLWGEAVQNNQNVRDSARTTLDKLLKIKYSLLGLMESVLYKQIPRRAQVADHLTMTNILRDDPHYRSVGLLWLEWTRHGAVKQKSSQEKYQDYQDTCRGFNRFCLLLVVRAFTQLAYKPMDDSLKTPLTSNKPLVLQGWHGQVGLHVKSNGLIELVEPEGGLICLRIVPVLAALGEQDPDTQEKAYLELAGCLSHSTEPTPLTLVLYPGEASEKLSMCLHGLPHENAGLFENLGVLPVSPWEIASVEHVARALRWALAGSLIKNYPPLIQTEKPLELSRTPDCLIQRAKNCWGLSEPMPPQESGWLKNELTNQENKFAQFQQQLEDERHAGQNQRRSGHRRVTERYKQLQVEYKDAENHLNTLKDFQQQFFKAQQYYQHLLCCPVCGQGHSNMPGFLKKRAQDTFFCTCDCGTQWELRPCHTCHERYPILLPHVENLSTDKTKTGWLDKSLGMDTLSVPKSDKTFICPHCFK